MKKIFLMCLVSAHLCAVIDFIQQSEEKNMICSSTDQVPIAFETERLYAQKATACDARYIQQIVSNKQIQEIYNSGDLEKFTDVQAQLSIIHDQWEKYGYGLYTLFNRKTAEFIGFAGYHTAVCEDSIIQVFDITQTEQHELELYVLLMPDFWRQGYGSEITTKLIELAFMHLPYKSIIAYAEPRNEASIQLIKKLQFKEESACIYNNKQHLLFRLYKNKNCSC